MIAALFVEPQGVYFGLPNVDPWDAQRDARKYDGPYPVVAHPPCERWGRYWGGGPSAKVKRRLGDDGGCFESALASVKRFGITRPEWRRGWIPATHGGFVCCVAQGHYGHRARKLTWLFAYNCRLVRLNWSIPAPSSRLDYGFHSKKERAERKSIVAPRVNKSRLTTSENLATPIAFRDVLIKLAASSSLL